MSAAVRTPAVPAARRRRRSHRRHRRAADRRLRRPTGGGGAGTGCVAGRRLRRARPERSPRTALRAQRAEPGAWAAGQCGVAGHRFAGAHRRLARASLRHLVCARGAVAGQRGAARRRAGGSPRPATCPWWRTARCTREQAVSEDRVQRARAARRWCSAATGVLRSRSFTPAQRLAVLAWAVRPLSGLRRVVFLVLLGSAILAGAVPFHATATVLVCGWLPAFVYTSLGARAAQRLDAASGRPHALVAALHRRRLSQPAVEPASGRFAAHRS